MREFLQGKRDQHDEEIKKYFLTKDTSIIKTDILELNQQIVK